MNENIDRIKILTCFEFYTLFLRNLSSEKCNQWVVKKLLSFIKHTKFESCHTIVLKYFKFHTNKL